MKAILVVDIPDDVNVDINNLIVKDITFKDISSNLGITHTIHKPKISIRPLPEKIPTPKIIQEQIDGWHKLAGQYAGYNACIDEILGAE